MRKAKIPADVAEEWYTREEAAEAMQVSLSTVDRLRSEGLIRSARYFGTAIVSRQSVQEYLARFCKSEPGVRGPLSYPLRNGARRASGH